MSSLIPPLCAPRNSSGQVKVYEVSAEGRTAWVDYIPVQDVTSGSADKFSADGYVPMEFLSDVSGLVEGKDYIPVVVVTGRTKRYSTDAVGFIPTIDVPAAGTEIIGQVLTVTIGEVVAGTTYGWAIAPSTPAGSASPDDPLINGQVLYGVECTTAGHFTLRVSDPSADLAQDDFTSIDVTGTGGTTLTTATATFSQAGGVTQWIWLSTGIDWQSDNETNETVTFNA